MSATTASSSIPARRDDAVSFKTWVGVFAATLGAFVAVLNIQVTNAALRHIEGGIGTGGANGAWISTSYLIGEIIIIPLAAHLSQVFSLRHYFLTNIVLFMIFSVACAFATSLSEMVVFRGLQGVAGGIMIPLAFTIVSTMLPPSKKPIGMAGFALSATFAPAIGPSIGGYVTENFGWQYIFYLNIVPCIVMLFALAWTLKREPMKLGLLKSGDWNGIAFMAIGLAALQTVLEEGNQNDWFNSAFILQLTVTAVVALSLFVWIELTKSNPVVNLRLLTQRNFGIGTFSNFFLGFGLYGSGYLLSVYLTTSHGYSAEQIGAVLMWTGLPQLVIIPFIPKLMGRFDNRVMVGVGLLTFAASCFMNLWMSRDYAADQLLVPNIVRALGMSLVMTPLSALAMIGVSAVDTGSASGLFNMMRNLGGAVGTATLFTFFTKREQFHSSVINTHVSVMDPVTRDRLAELKQSFMSNGVADPVEAGHKAMLAIGKTIRGQAELMGFSDTFLLLGVMLLLGAVSVMFLKKGVGNSAAGAH